MSSRSKFAWAASLVATALVVGTGTWFVTDRDRAESLGEPVADTEPADAESTPSWLFSATAAAGTYAENPDGTATLTLTDVDDDVTGFTDRPDRDTVVIPAPKLVEAWPTLFADSAPNAVLVTRDADGAAASSVLVLSDPRVDGSTLTFTAEVVNGKDHSSQLPGMTQAPSTSPPTAFSTVSLFIDNVLPSQMWVCSSGGGAPLSSPAPIPYPASSTATNTFEVQCLAAGGRPAIIGAAP